MKLDVDIITRNTQYEILAALNDMCSNHAYSPEQAGCTGCYYKDYTICPVQNFEDFIISTLEEKIIDIYYGHTVEDIYAMIKGTCIKKDADGTTETEHVEKFMRFDSMDLTDDNTILALDLHADFIARYCTWDAMMINELEIRDRKDDVIFSITRKDPIWFVNTHTDTRVIATALIFVDGRDTYIHIRDEPRAFLEVNADLVKMLRQCTGAELMPCLKALRESDGDLTEAICQLRDSSGARIY